MKRKYLRLPVAALLLSVLFLVPQPSFAAPEGAAPQAETRAKGDGLQWDGEDLVFLVNGKRIRNEWRTVDGKTYYFGRFGAALRGFAPRDGVLYFFDEKTCVQFKGGWLTRHLGTFYFNKYGVAYKGFRTIDGVEYYFEPEGCTQVKGSWFYASRPGVNWGLFYANPYGVVAKGYRWINGFFYRFDNKNGLCYIDSWGSNNGRTYYFGDDYCAVYGLQKINGVTHFFDLKTFAQYKNRWVSIGPKTYYFKSNGCAATGLLKLNGVLYIFDDNGVQYKNTQVTVGEYVYSVNRYGVATQIGSL